MPLVKRVVGLFGNPAHEWTVIANEPADIPALYVGHIMLLAAIPQLATLTGIAIDGGRYLGSMAIVTAITAAMVGYVMALAMPLGVALVLAALAPRFKSEAGTTEAMKVVAHAAIPIWLSGASYVVVEWSRADVVGALYAVYLFFGGLQPVMGAPIEQRVPMTLVTMIATLVLALVLSWTIQLFGLPLFGF